jgi:hypothetical protein
MLAIFMDSNVCTLCKASPGLPMDTACVITINPYNIRYLKYIDFFRKWESAALRNGMNRILGI